MRKGSIQHYAAVIDQISDPSAGQALGRPIPGVPCPIPKARTSAPPSYQAAASRSLVKSNRQGNEPRKKRRPSRTPENSEVLVSAVISTYLLTHLHHVLQRAEYGAVQDGRRSQAANYAQLRKVLCMDARSMEDASASGLKATELDQAA